MHDDSLSYVDMVTHACAKTLWAMAWADAMEERGLSVRGDIFEAMPPVPALAIVEAARIVARAETDNRLNIHACLAQAAEDDQDDHRFGMCLAYSYVGAGISWEDDHAPLMLALSNEPARRFTWPHGETPGCLSHYAADLVSKR